MIIIHNNQGQTQWSVDQPSLYQYFTEDDKEGLGRNPWDLQREE